MIVVYPLIVSKTINPNVLPGICKALEMYVLAYDLDNALDRANEQIKKMTKRGNFKIRAVGSRKKLTLEQVLYEDKKLEPDVQSPRQRPGQRSGTVSSKSPDSAGHVTVNVSPDKPKIPRDNIKTSKTADVGNPDNRSVTVEPTYMPVTTTDKGTFLIGVKVVPFVLNNEGSLLQLLKDDRFRTSLSTNIHFQTRRILKLMYRFANVLWKHTVGHLHWTGFVGKDLISGTLTQDWKSDMILGRTSFKDNLFLALNQMDVDDMKKNGDEFLTKPGGITKLHHLGWASFIVVDDINKRASFCMKNYKGLCSVVNYSFLYGTISREASAAFQDIEDVRRSAGPFLRMKGRFNKMITENDLASEKYKSFSREELFNEGLLEAETPEIDRVIPPIVRSQVKNVESAIKRKDLKLTKNILLKIHKNKPLLSLEKYISQLRKMKGFESNFSITKKVFMNSLPPGGSTKFIEAGAAIVAAVSLFSNDQRKTLHNNIKIVVDKTRKVAKSSKDESWDLEIVVAFAFGVIMMVVSAITLIAAVQIILKLGIGLLSGITEVLFWAAVIGISIHLINFALGFISGGGGDE